MSDTQHWQTVYASRGPEALTWYQPHLTCSLGLIGGLSLAPDARIVDVGGGAATLVDDLLALGHRRLAVVDLSRTALAASRARLGARAERVDWIVGDITTGLLSPGSVDLWHDRAVFHFLTRPEERAAYLAQAAGALRPGGYAVVATFAPDGPERCSGLPVVRYDAAGLAAAFGDRFEPIAEDRELHRTPGGGVQPFTYVLLRRRP